MKRTGGQIIMDYLIREGVPYALGAAMALLGGIGVVVGLVSAIAPSVVRQWPQLWDQAQEGILQLKTWAAGPPLIIGAAGAGPLFAGGFRVSVLSLCHGLALFLCLCHSYLQKSITKRRLARSAGGLSSQRSGQALPLPSNHRIEFIVSAPFHERRVGSAQHIATCQSICSMRPRRSRAAP